MGQDMLLALDAMGGDRAPGMVVDGAELALERFPDLRFLMVGRESALAPLLSRTRRLKERVEILHTDEVITNDTKPSLALRNGRGSSMRLAIDAVRDGRCAGVVSAGNTGALMALAKFALRPVPGVERPAIAGLFPTLRGESVMLDLGANVQCDARNLVQFAVMGEVFARTVLGLTQPSVGLLNVGAEDQKGNEAVKAAAAFLRAGDGVVDFHGFVEGDDIAAGTVDVVVTDGFTGNVALKTAEGTARLITQFMRESFRSSLWAKLGYVFSRTAIARLRRRVDPRRYNGAIFLGVKGVVVKSHGGTDALGFANAIGVAVDMGLYNFIDRIQSQLARLPEELTVAPAAVG
ncbi:MAG: phosphate acyltransferase PlsX [Thalassobaculales bacterium]